MLSQINEDRSLKINSYKERRDLAKKNRILWLINHTTLRDFEIPMLISLGFEVYTPKNIPEFIHEWSGSNCYDYDGTLTIPSEDLAILNQHDFYDGEMTETIAAIINKYFASAFCVFYPALLNEVVKNFHGHVLLRAFGLDKSTSYTKVIEDALGRNFFTILKKMGNRFWFSESYDNLNEIEHYSLKNRAIYHPLGLPESFFKHQNTWVGGEKKILFFCSRINASPTYYGKIYKEFKQNFGDIPHLIAGNQPIAVDDPCVAGKQSRDTLDQWLKSYAVMYYHSEEPRHLHYHPLEAIIFGMPLIFMRKGILEHMGGKDQPGACETIQEAREKIHRIIGGDTIFINEILKRQVEMLTAFSLEFAKKLWQENFIDKVLVEEITYTNIKPIHKIGLFLPVPYKGGSLVAAKNIAKMIVLGSEELGDNIQLVFSCVENEYNAKADFRDLTELGITVRETKWIKLIKQQVEAIQNFAGKKSNLDFQQYLLPTDGICNFNDCDFWLVISDRTCYPLAPIKPYGMVIYDYIQRYVPEITHGSGSAFDNYIASARQANFVLTTTPQTAQDAIQFAGVKASAVHLIPMEFEPVKADACQLIENEEPYFLWPTNTSPHKNHLKALEALHIYYNELNGSYNVHITGSDTEDFSNSSSPCNYVKQVVEAINKSSKTRQSIHIFGDLPRKEFANKLKKARFVWHPTKIDNGTYAAVEAAYLGVPTLSNDYPQMHYINERFRLNLQFINMNEPYKVALKLKEMEKMQDKLRLHLPKQEFLEQFSYESLAANFWSSIWKLM